jgi:RNA polymerase sigma factor (sigma-70 family)
MKKVVFTFGRMNPPTVGHQKLVDKVKAEAKKQSADARIYLSHTQNKKKDPLDYNTKVKYATKAFGSVVTKTTAKTIIQVLKELQDAGYTDVTLIVGSDRIPEFKKLLTKYNGKDYQFNSINFISAGQRDPDAEGVSGISASKMRALAMEGDLASFKSGLPKALQTSAKEIYNKLRNIMEEDETQLDEGLINDMIHKLAVSAKMKKFVRWYLDWRKKNPGQGKEGVVKAAKIMGLNPSDANAMIKSLNDMIAKGKLPKHLAITEEVDLEEASLTLQQRQKRSRLMKRLAKKIQRKAKVQKRRMADSKRLQKRALKKARQMVRKKVAGEKGTRYASLSSAEKISIDKLVDKKQPLIAKIAKKLMPKVRRAEMERLKKARGGSVNEETETLSLNERIDPRKEPNLFRALTAIEKEKQRDLQKFDRMRDNARVRDTIYRNRKEEVVDEVAQDKDIKDKEGSQPAKYHSGLKKSTKATRDAQFKKGAEMSHKDPKAYPEKHAGDDTAKTRTSKHTKKYHDMFGESTAHPIQNPPGGTFDAGDYPDPGTTPQEMDKARSKGQPRLKKSDPRIDGPDAGDSTKRMHYAQFMAKENSWNDRYRMSADPRNPPAVNKPAKKYTKPEADAISKKMAASNPGSKPHTSYVGAHKGTGRSGSYVPGTISNSYEVDGGYEITEESKGALQKKADKSGIPYSILKKVYDRGMAAWRTGHRPGAGQEQWAYARVNSFITKGKGTWGGADKDLAAKVKKESFELEEDINTVIDLNRALNKLDKREKEIILMRFKYNMSMAKIGKELGISATSALQAYERAMRKLKARDQSIKNAIATHKESFELENEACWDGYKQVGMKKKGDKMVPDCVPEAKNPAQQAAIAIAKKKKYSDMVGGLKETDSAQPAVKKTAYAKHPRTGNTFNPFSPNDAGKTTGKAVAPNQSPRGSRALTMGEEKEQLDELLPALAVAAGAATAAAGGYAAKKAADKLAVKKQQQQKAISSIQKEAVSPEKDKKRLKDILPKSGAGQEGTDELVATYKKDTPGQMNENFSPVYTAKDLGIKAEGGFAYHPSVEEFVEEYEDWGELEEAAEYQGRKVKLNNPFRLPSGSKKKFGVYVKNDKGNVVKVTFGDPNMEIKRDDPARRKAFRSRHSCDDNIGPKWKARYWSCYQWRAGKKVDN